MIVKYCDACHQEILEGNQLAQITIQVAAPGLPPEAGSPVVHLHICVGRCWPKLVRYMANGVPDQKTEFDIIHEALQTELPEEPAENLS